jgi:hypothetical protein
VSMSEQELSEIWRRAGDQWRERGWNQATDDVEALLDEIKRLRAEIAALRDALRDMVATYELEAGETEALTRACALLGETPAKASESNEQR